MRRPSTRRRFLGATAGAFTIGVAGCLGSPGEDDSFQGTVAVSDAHQYSAPGCTCCGEYATYLDDHLDGSLDHTEADDVAAVKQHHGVPDDLRSCHTVVLDEYVVEGHVPASAIAMLYSESPDIDGIALPGMPAGSPGMGGSRSTPLTIYVIGGDRTGEVFVEV